MTCPAEQLSETSTFANTSFISNSTNSNDSKTADVVTHDALTLELLELFEFVFGCVLITSFALLGLIGTSVNLIVLSRYNITKDSSNILLLALSLADFLFCLTIPISRSKCILSQIFDMPTALRWYMYIFENFSPISRVFYFCSITMVGVISVERFLVVFFPFRASLILTPFRMKVTVALVYASNLLLFSPTFFSFGHDYVCSSKYRGLVPVLKPTQFYLNNYQAINIVVGIVQNITLLGTALVLMVTLTPAIAVKLWFVTNERAKLTNRKCQFEPQVVKILLTVCTLSLLIYGPFVCYEAAIVFLPEHSSMSTSFQVFLIVTDFSGTICASVNFIIYITMSGKFRKKYNELFSKLCTSSKTTN